MSETTNVTLPASFTFNQEIILIAMKGGTFLPGDIGEKINNSVYEIKTSTLYPILNRMEKSGFIYSETIDSKRLYSLTDQGLQLIETTEKVRKTINGKQNNNDQV